jgi:hypothetical protein
MAEKRRWVAIQVRDSLKKRLEEEYEKQKVELFKRGITSFTAFVNTLIWHAVEADSYLMKYSPYLSYIGHNESNSGVYIYDYKMDRICEVSYKNGELYCDVDDSTRCVHVGFAYALPEMYSVLKKLGYKNPRSTE